MTYEEAIKLFKDCAGDPEFEEAIDLAIEALEKQIPKKPKLKKVSSTLTTSVCPNCGSVVHQIYCPECGQVLDWIDYE